MHLIEYMDKSGVYHIVESFLAGSLSHEEQQAFYNMLSRQDLNGQILDALDRFTGEVYPSDKTDEGVLQIVERICKIDRPDLPQVLKMPSESPVKWSRNLIRYAAIFLIMIGAGAFWLMTRTSPENHQLSQKEANRPVLDIPPGGNKAMLTLSDGSVIMLDSVANGKLSRQGKVEVIKNTNGRLSYINSPDTESELAILYNTLTTPNGGQYELNLPDGTKVWLNAASSITYPTTFSGEERVVQVTGEVYFEVAAFKGGRGIKKPFRVTINKETEVEVLGTHFNINAYANESGVQTTLLEGAVKVNHRPQVAQSSDIVKSILLKAGEQVKVTEHKKEPFVVRAANISEVMAWKNGLFNFDEVSLQEVMRELARWYDLEIVYEKEVPSIEFGGKMSRNVSLMGLLKGLERAGLHFRIEYPRRLVVFP